MEFKEVEKELVYLKSLKNRDELSKDGENLVKELELLLKQREEMLEFIINVFNTMPNGSIIQEKAKQLIKESTEI
jgi:hypothetical protein